MKRCPNPLHYINTVWMLPLNKASATRQQATALAPIMGEGCSPSRQTIITSATMVNANNDGQPWRITQRRER